MTLSLRRGAYAVAAAALFLSALAQAQAPVTAAADPNVVAPNANLHIEGIPPIPKSIADSVANCSARSSWPA